jgi:hypothetical protein
VWSDTGVVGFVRSAGDEAADITIGWRRGRHGACEPLGPNAEIAHAGPSAPGSFVHFDLARRFDEEGVFATTLHELGHILGLCHSDATGAVMSTDLNRPAAPTRDDIAGLHSLYGGGVDAPGDLDITRADGSRLSALRATAPTDCCDFTVFDADGDGRAEVIVWRTDAAGHGALMLFSFVAEAKLVRTLGPFYGAVVPGVPVGCVVLPGGRRLLVSQLSAQPAVVRELGRFGVPGMPEAAIDATLAAQAARSDRGDLDGDGSIEIVVRR